MDIHSFHQNFQKIVNRARGYSASDCEDLAQEVFLRLWKSGLPQPWSPAVLHHTLGWVIKDHYRKHSSKVCVPLFDQPDYPSVESAIFARQLLSREPHAAIVERSVIGGLSPAEIAALDGTNANTVTVRKHRALARMREAAMAA